MFFEQSLSLKKSQYIFIIRHAEKHLSSSLEEDIKVSITSQGQIAAEQFGKKLFDYYGNFQAIKSSPIKRCVETAQIIAENCKLKINKINLSNKLGDPGVFVSNDKAAGEHYINLGVKDVVHQQIAGKSLEGLRNIDEAITLLLEDVAQDLKLADKPILYITHDAILAPFTWRLMKHKPKDDEWFNFLDGVIIEKHEKPNGCVFLIWNGKKVDISKHFLK